MNTFEGLMIQIKKTNRKTLSLQVLRENNNQIILFVKIPHFINSEQLSSILESKRTWIKKSKENLLLQEMAKEKLLSDYSIVNNGILPFKGRKMPVMICTDPSIPKIKIQENDDRLMIKRNPNFLNYSLELPHILKDFYYQQAYKEFSQLIEYYSRKYGFNVKHLRIKDTKTRWGSCSAKMNVNLNWKLIIAHHRVYEYVIVHELCHIGCWNHSKRFWNRVSSILPDYQDRKNELKRISEFLSAFSFSKLEMET